jgi:hypothetical protein
MRRTVIQFDDATHWKLRRQAFRQARSISWLVCEIVARDLQTDTGRKGRTRRSKQGRLSAVSEKHDEALDAVFET